MFLQKINFHSAIFVCLVSLVFQPALAAPPEAYNFLPFDKALIKSADDNKPMFLYFGRYGCNTCRKMHKEVFSDPSLRQNLSSHFVLAYVDTDMSKTDCWGVDWCDSTMTLSVSKSFE